MTRRAEFPRSPESLARALVVCAADLADRTCDAIGRDKATRRTLVQKVGAGWTLTVAMYEAASGQSHELSELAKKLCAASVMELTVESKDRLMKKMDPIGEPPPNSPAPYFSVCVQLDSELWKLAVRAHTSEQQTALVAMFEGVLETKRERQKERAQEAA